MQDQNFLKTSYSKDVLCVAPFSALLVDPNKQVRPCCVYTGSSWGNIKTDKIEDILNHPDRLKLQEDMKTHTWNQGCNACKTAEQHTQRSVRTGNFQNITVTQSIQYLEYNGSNICNLTCVMCNPFFSSAWVNFNKKHNLLTYTASSVFLDRMVHGPNTEIAETFFKTLNLTELKNLMLKGGEPFLNKENILLLKHLFDLGILQNVAVSIVTNGTLVNDEMLDLLSNAKGVSVTVSKDGPNDLNKWIRWNDINPDLSSDKNIKFNIERLLTLPNIRLLKNTFSLQAYNVFRLEEHRDWWESQIVPLSKLVKSIEVFDYFVYTQNYNIPVLTDSTRQLLVKKYKSLNNSKLYNYVIKQLELPYAGHNEHNTFVSHTKKTDLTRDKSIIKIVPELETELQFL